MLLGRARGEGVKGRMKRPSLAVSPHHSCTPFENRVTCPSGVGGGEDVSVMIVERVSKPI